MALDESKESKDNTLVVNEIKMLIDKNLKESMGHAPLTINYHKSSYGEGFIIDNGSAC